MYEPWFSLNICANRQPSILNEILKRLNNMDKKLCQLNTIQSSVHKITERLDTMDFRIKEIEKSQHFLSEHYDKLSTNILDNSICSKAMKTGMKVLSDANYNMRQKQESLMNDIIHGLEMSFYERQSFIFWNR